MPHSALSSRGSANRPSLHVSKVYLVAGYFEHAQQHELSSQEWLAQTL